MYKKDIVGSVFGKLRVLREAGRTSRGLVLWECICECGQHAIVTGTRLRRGTTKSCGCMQWAHVRAQGSHMHCKRGAVSPTWSSWKSMLDRCRPEHKSHAYYFDAGVRVCADWFSFSKFLEDMGERPSGTTLDRVHNSQGYCKSNCRWVLLRVQANNKSSVELFEYEGEAKSLAEWARDSRCRVCYATLHKRVRVYGVSFPVALTQTSRRSK